jgi:hypothetical protein
MNPEKNNNRKGKPKNNNQRPQNGNGNGNGNGRNVSRGAALRAQKQAVQDANRIANQYQDASSKQMDITAPAKAPRQPN